MHRRPIWFLIVCIISLAALITLSYYFSPTTPIIIAAVHISLLIPAGMLVFLFVASVISYSLKSLVHGILAGLFVVSYLALRVNNLTYPLFVVLLAAFFLMLEFLFYKKKS